MFSRTTLIGRLGDEPVLRYTQAQKPVVTLSVATSESWKDKNGERKELTEWHRVVLFGGTAETASKYLKKGGLALFEGTIRTRKWTDSSGTERYTTEIHADTLKMLPSGQGPGHASAGQAVSNGATSHHQNNPQPSVASADYAYAADYSEYEDDITF